MINSANIEYQGKLYRLNNHVLGNLDMIIGTARKQKPNGEYTNAGKIVLSHPFETKAKLKDFFFYSRPLVCDVEQFCIGELLAEATYGYTESMLNVQQRSVELKWLCTHFKHRGQKLAFQTMQGLAKEAREANMPRIHGLACNTSIPFYEKLGCGFLEGSSNFWIGSNRPKLQTDELIIDPERSEWVNDIVNENSCIMR